VELLVIIVGFKYRSMKVKYDDTNKLI